MLVVHHVPICPFSQRLEILLALKGCREVEFRVVDVTQPRPSWLLAKTGGSTSLPILETESGTVLKESLVILRYLDERFPEPRIAHPTAEGRAIEGMLVSMEGDFTAWGYRYVMNQDPDARAALRKGMEERFARLDAFLMEHSPTGDFLFDRFGMAEVTSS